VIDSKYQIKVANEDQAAEKVQKISRHLSVDVDQKDSLSVLNLSRIGE
jgi:hypothetical protein